MSGCAPLVRAQPRTGVFARILAGLAAEEPEEKTAMIDATCLKTHRTATSLRVKKGGPTTSADA